jgi:hypothetical protein
MANYFKDNEDLQYYFDKGIDWESLVEISEYGYKSPDGFTSADEAVEFYRDIAEMVGEFSAEEIAPHSAAIDRTGVKLVDGEAVLPDEMNAIFKRIKGLDLHGMTLPRELGGMNAPMLLYFINTEIMGRADVSVMAHHSFHGGMAMAMLIFSVLEGSSEIDPKTFEITKTRFADYIDEIAEGKAWGCMDITEPDAGSDMAALRSVGEQDADGNWFVTGQKIFITSGHGKYHFVISRTEPAGDADDPLAGLAGLSMFLVPTYADNADGTRTRLATVDRVEHKMGHHGSVTATISFDRTPAHLIGERGEGFKYMLYLMNNARLGVGFEAIGMCESAYRMARDYAAERPSMGKTIDRHEMIADYLDEMRTDIAGIRAIAMHGAVHEELAQKLKLRIAHDDSLDAVTKKRLEGDMKRHQAAARKVTPLLKYMAAEKAVSMARLNVQIHGGNGYMKEYGAEKLLRDAMVMPIYEGTSQIQALMAMKDAMGNIIKNPQEFVKKVAQVRWRTLSSRDGLERRVAKVSQLSLAAQQHLVTKTAADQVRSLSGMPLTAWPRTFLRDWNPKKDFAYAMLHAERLIKLLSDEAICEVLLAQAKAHPERREVLEAYLDRCEPRARFLHDEITTTGGRLLAMLGRDEADSEKAAG